MKKIIKTSAFILALIITLTAAQTVLTVSALPEGFLAGVRYNEIIWNDADMANNPFGTAKYFNGFIFENLENIIDTEGAVAVGGNFTSSRGYSMTSMHTTGGGTANHTTFNTGLIVGGDISFGGYVSVLGGHIVVSSTSNVAKKSGSEAQVKAPTSAETAEFNKLTDMYRANNFSGFAVQNGNTQIRANEQVYVTDKQIYNTDGHLASFFGTAKTKLKAKSNALAAKPQTAGVSFTVNQWDHNIDITCVPNVVNYITLDLSTTAAGSILDIMKQTDPMNISLKGMMRFKNLGTGIAVVNVVLKENAIVTTQPGANFGISDSNSKLFGQVMLNIPQKATLKHSGSEMITSILAPDLSVEAIGGGGNIYGTSVIKSLKTGNNGFELHNFAFKGFPNDTPPPTPDPLPLGWMRSTEIKDASFLKDVVSGKDAWNFDEAFRNTPIKYFENEDVRTKANQKVADGSEYATPAGEQLVGIRHIWDNGNYFDKYKIQNADVSYDWASWSHHGISGDTTNKGQYSIRRFAAYVEYSQAQLDALQNVFLAPKDELGNRSYLFPINDNAFVFINGTLVYWGGTDIVSGDNQFGALNRTAFMNKNGIKVRSGVNDVFKTVYPHTDGWCIDLEENKDAVNIKSLLTSGFNRIDIITDEYWEGGGMNRLYLFDEK